MAISRVDFNAASQTQSISGVTPITATPSVSDSDVKYAYKEDVRSTATDKEEEESAAIIAESEDGDLLTGELKARYTPEEKTTVIAESEDGIVSKIDKVPADEELVTDLTGYTKSQVEQLYREGKISRYNYEQNMQKREELQEEANLETQTEDNQFANNMSQIIADERQQNIEADALSKAIQNGRSDLMLDVFSNLSKG